MSVTNDNLPGVLDPESREYASCERTHATGTTHYHPLRVKTLIDKFEDRRALTSPPPDDERLRAARFVATHWRDAFMMLDGPARVGSHPLAMVLAALDGETEPRELGLSDDVHDAFRAALTDEPGETHEEPR